MRGTRRTLPTRATVAALTVAALLPLPAAIAASRTTNGVVLRVDPLARLSADAAATYSGTVTCKAPQTVWLWSQVRQGGSTSLADEPYGNVLVRCNGRPTAWTWTVSAYVGPAFSTGTATVWASMVVWPGEPFTGSATTIDSAPVRQVRLLAGS